MGNHCPSDTCWKIWLLHNNMAISRWVWQYVMCKYCGDSEIQDTKYALWDLRLSQQCRRGYGVCCDVMLCQGEWFCCGMIVCQGDWSSTVWRNVVPSSSGSSCPVSERSWCVGVEAPVSGTLEKLMSQLGEVWESPGCTVVVKRGVARYKAEKLDISRKLVSSDQS
jgi:hypothetical protein